jgi:hypothetical protein
VKTIDGLLGPEAIVLVVRLSWYVMILKTWDNSTLRSKAVFLGNLVQSDCLSSCARRQLVNVKSEVSAVGRNERIKGFRWRLISLEYSLWGHRHQSTNSRKLHRYDFAYLFSCHSYGYAWLHIPDIASQISPNFSLNHARPLISSWFHGLVLRFDIGACDRQWTHVLLVA